MQQHRPNSCASSESAACIRQDVPISAFYVKESGLWTLYVELWIALDICFYASLDREDEK